MADQQPSPHGTRQRHRIELLIRSNGRLLELTKEVETSEQIAVELEKAAQRVRELALAS